MEISEIKTVMKKQGITQIELAKKANIPLQTVRKIFAGITVHPRIDTVQAIKKALGLNNDLKQEGTLNELENELLSLFKVLSRKNKELLLKIAKIIHEERCYE